jgi:hypothetical protein
MMEAIDHFGENGWPEEIVTTWPCLKAVSEQRGAIRYKSRMNIFPMAGFSGTLAMRAAALDEHDEIYLLGFDGGDGQRFYDDTGDREEFGTAYTSLRDIIVEGFPEVKWHLYDAEKWEFVRYERECEMEGWVR